MVLQKYTLKIKKLDSEYDLACYSMSSNTVNIESLSNKKITINRDDAVVRTMSNALIKINGNDVTVSKGKNKITLRFDKERNSATCFID